MNKPKRETVSVGLKIDELKDRCGEKEWRLKEFKRRILDVLHATSFLEPRNIWVQDRRVEIHWRHNGQNICWCLYGGKCDRKEQWRVASATKEWIGLVDRRPLLNERNRMGSSAEPWGTTAFRRNRRDMTPLTLTGMVRLLRKLHIYDKSRIESKVEQLRQKTSVLNSVESFRQNAQLSHVVHIQ